MIEVRDIRVERGGQIIIDRIDLTIPHGQVVGIVGPNGSGKSTLLLVLYRALDVQSGKVEIDSVDISTMSRRAIASKIAVVAQERDASLDLSVRDSVALGRLSARHLIGYGDESDQMLIDQALARVELSDMSQRLVSQLSGGERQRVMIARAIVQQADHLLLDEPTNHLDLRHQFALLDLISTLSCTTVVVLHDLNLAAACCDQIIVLDHGAIAASGPAEDVLIPEVIEPIYRLDVTSVIHHGRPHLIFDPIRKVQI